MLGGRGDSLQSLRERDALTGSTRSVDRRMDNVMDGACAEHGISVAREKGFSSRVSLVLRFGWGKRSENVFS